MGQSFKRVAISRFTTSRLVSLLTINGLDLSSIRRLRSYRDFAYREFLQLLPLISQVVKSRQGHLYGLAPSFNQRL
jgi:hypothetical protein